MRHTITKYKSLDGYTIDVSGWQFDIVKDSYTGFWELRNQHNACITFQRTIKSITDFLADLSEDQLEIADNLQSKGVK